VVVRDKRDLMERLELQDQQERPGLPDLLDHLDQGETLVPMEHQDLAVQRDQLVLEGTQDPLVKLVLMGLLVSLVVSDLLGLLGQLERQGLLAHRVVEVHRDNPGPRDNLGTLEPRVSLEQLEAKDKLE